MAGVAAPPGGGHLAPGALEAALGAQRVFMNQYGDQLEQMLSLLVYMVPVQDAEDDHAGFYSQAVFSITDLFGLYRTVLLRSPEALPILEPNGAAVSGSTMRGARLKYTMAAFALRALRSFQVLLEMYAARTSTDPQRALRVCVRIEAVKLLLKLALRKLMPFSFYIDEAALEDAEPPAAQNSLADTPASSQATFAATSAAPGSGGSDAFVGRRTGRTLRGLGAEGTMDALGVTQSTSGIVADRTPVSALILAAEVVFHGRPFLHLAMLLRRGHRSWAAWLTAFCLDRVALGLLLTGVQPRPDSRAASLELAELKRRRRLMWWALIRSPLFDLALRRPCEALDRILKRIPIVNLFNIVEFWLALQPFYFTSSAS